MPSPASSSSSIDSADRDDLTAVTSLNATLKAYTAYVDMRISRRANELKAVGESGGGFETLLGGNGSVRDAKAAEERDRACTTVPGFEDALADGEVSAEHVDVLARLTKGLDGRGAAGGRSRGRGVAGRGEAFGVGFRAATQAVDRRDQGADAAA